MYGTEEFAHALRRALHDGGLVAGPKPILNEHNVMEEKDNDDDDDDDGIKLSGSLAMWIALIQNLETAGFYSLKDYTEPRAMRQESNRRPFSSSFSSSFFVATTDRLGHARWFAPEAQIDLELARRATTRRSTTTTAASTNTTTTRTTRSFRVDNDNGDYWYKVMDGATMAVYQTPSRKTENHFCHYAEEYLDDDDDDDMEDKYCGIGLDPDVPNAPRSWFEVRPSTNPKAGRGVFTKRDIGAPVYMGLEDGVHAMLILPQTLQLIETLAEDNVTTTTAASQRAGMATFFEPLDAYATGYGTWIYFYGQSATTVDPGIFTLVNHGCNGTYHTNDRLSVTEGTASIHDIPDTLQRRNFYDPHLHRRHWLDQGCIDLLVESVSAGTEILGNYLYLSEGPVLEEWETSVLGLRTICQGQFSETMSTVTEYEQWEQEGRGA